MLHELLDRFSKNVPIVAFRGTKCCNCCLLGSAQYCHLGLLGVDQCCNYSLICDAKYLTDPV